MRVALQHKLGVSFHFWRSEKLLDSLNDRALELLDTVGLRDLAEVVTVELPTAASARSRSPPRWRWSRKMMLLDEPTQGMGHEDVERVTQLIKKVSAGRTVLMVEHNMNVVASIADTITVLARGSVIAEGPYETVSKNAQVLEAYMGSEAAELQGAHG